VTRPCDPEKLAREVARAVALGFLHPLLAWAVLRNQERKARR
jgi:hypothetical protein